MVEYTVIVAHVRLLTELKDRISCVKNATDRSQRSPMKSSSKSPSLYRTHRSHYLEEIPFR